MTLELVQMGIETPPVRRWSDLYELLFEGSWNPGLGRFRSGHAFRGMTRVGAGLVTSLVRLGGGYEGFNIDLANEIAKNDAFAVAMEKRAINRVWEVAGLREAIASNVELDALIEAADLPERAEFRRITLEEGLRRAIEWRDARFRAPHG